MTVARQKLIFPCLIIMILLSGLSLIPHIYAQGINSQAQPEITDITIEGNKAVSTNTILSKIKTHVGGKFQQKAVNADIKRLYATGFFTDVTAEVENYEGGVRLILSVLEKSVVGSIVFEGNNIYKDAVLLKQIETKDGDALNRRLLAEDVKR